MDISYVKTKLNFSELIGRPYRTGGRGPSDFDCWGLCMKVSEAIGRPLPDLEVPQNNDLRFQLIEQQRGHFERLDKAIGGCLVLFRVIDDHNRIKWHVGTVLPNGRHFIHITEKVGVHVASLDGQPWKLFIEGFYRYQP